MIYVLLMVRFIITYKVIIYLESKNRIIYEDLIGFLQNYCGFTYSR